MNDDLDERIQRTFDTLRQLESNCEEMGVTRSLRIVYTDIDKVARDVKSFSSMGRRFFCRLRQIDPQFATPYSTLIVAGFHPSVSPHLKKSDVQAFYRRDGSSISFQTNVTPFTLWKLSDQSHLDDDIRDDSRQITMSGTSIIDESSSIQDISKWSLSFLHLVGDRPKNVVSGAKDAEFFEHVYSVMRDYVSEDAETQDLAVRYLMNIMPAGILSPVMWRARQMEGGQKTDNSEFLEHIRGALNRLMSGESTVSIESEFFHAAHFAS